MMASATFDEWKKLSEFLIVKYIDGNVKKEENGEFVRDQYGRSPSPDQPGYPEWWYEKVAGDTGDHLKVKFRSSRQQLAGIGWGLGYLYNECVYPDSRLDVACSIEMSAQTSGSQPVLKLLDLKPQREDGLEQIY